MIGYDAIPERWMRNLREVEGLNFAYTDISLDRAYRMSFGQAVEMIRRNGGTVTPESVSIVCQEPRAVRLEKSFEGHRPTERRSIQLPLPDVGEIVFDGIGAVLTGA